MLCSLNSQFISLAQISVKLVSFILITFNENHIYEDIIYFIHKLRQIRQVTQLGQK